MNLGRVKSFLIYLFLAINIYLVVSLAMSSSFRIDDTTINNTVKILSDSGVSIEKEIIPKKVKNLKNIEAVNIIYTDAFKESENYKNFEISGNSFSYTQKNDILYSLKDSKIKKQMRKFLVNSGFDANYMTFSEISKTKDEKKLEITCTVNNYSVFDSKITAEISKDSLKLYGIWYEPKTNSVLSNSRTRNTVYITSVLIDLAENETFKKGSKKITGIEYGYMSGTLYGNKGHITATALPYYQITDEAGKIYYYDASDGTYNNSVSE